MEVSRRAGEVAQGILLAVLLVAVTVSIMTQGDFSGISFRYVGF
jgi:hypothetical protein